jgi:DNA segregation ATPase FtsK/SpoIIIE-like protein
LRAGTAHATRYQQWVSDAFTFLFGDILKDPQPESRTFYGTLRRDITLRNAAEKGSWFDWKLQYQVDPLLIECKNKETLTYDDLRQTAAYLGKRMGRLAVLACRKSTGGDVWEMLNWFVNNDEKYILVVNDEDLIDWIRLKDRGENPTDAIADLYRTLREGAQ